MVDEPEAADVGEDEVVDADPEEVVDADPEEVVPADPEDVVDTDPEEVVDAADEEVVLLVEVVATDPEDVVDAADEEVVLLVEVDVTPVTVVDALLAEVLDGPLVDDPVTAGNEVLNPHTTVFGQEGTRFLIQLGTRLRNGDAKELLKLVYEVPCVEHAPTDAG